MSHKILSSTSSFSSSSSNSFRFTRKRTRRIEDELLPGDQTRVFFLRSVQQIRLEAHSERQPERLQLVLDFVQRLLAEIAILEHFALALHRQLADGRDIRVVQ